MSLLGVAAASIVWLLWLPQHYFFTGNKHCHHLPSSSSSSSSWNSLDRSSSSSTRSRSRSRSRLHHGGSSCLSFKLQQHQQQQQQQLSVVLFASQSIIHDDNDESSHQYHHHHLPFRDILMNMGVPYHSIDSIMKQLIQTGLVEDETGTSETLQFITKDFINRPEVISTLLISDFGFQPLMAHQVRAGVMTIFQKQQQQQQRQQQQQQLSKTTTKDIITSDKTVTTIDSPTPPLLPLSTKSVYGKLEVPPSTNREDLPLPPPDDDDDDDDDNEGEEEKPLVRRPLYKSVIVNQKARQRKQQQQQQLSSSSSSSSSGLDDTTTTTNNNGNLSNDYGLPSNYETLFPTIAIELEEFYTFMTRPVTQSQDDPIRPATATVYMRHARQFLGWYANTHDMLPPSTIIAAATTTTTTGDNTTITATTTTSNSNNNSSSNPVNSTKKNELSLYTIFPNKEKKSADAVLNFILWLRSTRRISVSYEANILRGLTKVLKFRFAKESQSDPGYGEKSFDDIPLIREIRKLHRDANKRQRVAPRSSDETQKWLSWPEYLQVVQQTQSELLNLLEQYNTNTDTDTNNNNKKKKKKQKLSAKDNHHRQSQQNKATTDNQKELQQKYSPLQRKIAALFQKYLILAIFSSVPDRQRTIRELEIGRSFQKDEVSGCWCIKHAPEDYKTGKAYGERPLLQLSDHLTPWIDTFVQDWRICLVPKSQTLFIQPRTGKPLTQDSVYQIVGRACHQHTGKRTNPHLLRDMLVTHVRESDASEKQLEALALYMGHSIQMQRSSYDRRTLTKKVAPAVELMQSVNSQAAFVPGGGGME